MVIDWLSLLTKWKASLNLSKAQASAVEDAANEQASQAAFLGLVNDLQTTGEMLSSAHATAVSNREQAESKLASQERFLEEQ